MRTYSTLAATLFITLILAACGGGGGGDDSTDGIVSSSGDDTLPALTITESIADDVAAAVITIAASVSDLGDSTDTVTGVTVQIAGEFPHLNAVSSWQLQQLIGLREQLVNNTVIGAEFTGTIPCDSGFIAVTVNDVDDNGVLSPGDTAQLSYNNCRIVDMTFNGPGSITIISLSSNLESATFTYNNVSVSDSNVTGTLDGGFDFSLSTQDNGIVIATIEGERLTVTEPNVTETLSTFNFTNTFDNTMQAYSISVRGSLANTALNGRVDFESQDVFEGIGEAFPFAGRLLITGDSSSVLVTALADSVNVQLDVDLDGNGTIDTLPIFTT